MPEPIILPSGRTLVVNVAPFTPANKLRRTLAKEALAVRLDLGGLPGLMKPGTTIADVEVSSLPPEALDTMKNVFATLLASEPVEACMWECAGRSTIDDAKMDAKSFEDPKARGDFLPAAWEVIKANAAPFFESLGLSSLLAGAAPKSGPS